MSAALSPVGDCDPATPPITVMGFVFIETRFGSTASASARRPRPEAPPLSPLPSFMPARRRASPRARAPAAEEAARHLLTVSGADTSRMSMPSARKK